MSKATSKEMKAEIKELKGQQKESKATVSSYFKEGLTGDVDAKEAKAAIGAFEKSAKKIDKLMEKLEA